MRLKVVVPLLLLLMTLLACGGETPDAADTSSGDGAAAAVDDSAAEAESAAATNTPIPEPTATPTPIPTDTPTPEPVALDLEALGAAMSELQSIRYRFTAELTDPTAADGESFNITADYLLQNDPAAFEMILSSTQLGGEDLGVPETVTMVLLEDQYHMSLGQLGCFSGTGEELGMDPEEITSFTDVPDVDFDQVELVERNVEVNGFITDHYVFDLTLLDSNQLLPGMFGGSIDEDAAVGFQEGSGHIYIATQEGFMVRYIFDGTIAADGDTGTMLVQMDLLEVNPDVEIVLPEGCDDSGAGYPQLDDAFEAASFGTIASYKTLYTEEEIIAFYESEMAALGYTYDADASFQSSGFNTLVFTLDGTTVNVTIATDDESGGYAVIITEQ